MKLINVLTLVATTVSAGALAMPVGAITVTIPDTTPGGYTSFGFGDATVTYDNVQFSSSSSLGNGGLFNIGSNYYDNNPTAVLSEQEVASGVENILITLPTATTSFSLNYGTFDGGDVTFLLSNGMSYVQPSLGSSYLVPGVFAVASTPFSSVLVTSGDSVLNLNNISYAAGVPEPAAWSMILIGFCALGATMRTRRRNQAFAAI